MLFATLLGSALFFDFDASLARKTRRTVRQLLARLSQDGRILTVRDDRTGRYSRHSPIGA